MRKHRRDILKAGLAAGAATLAVGPALAADDTITTEPSAEGLTAKPGDFAFLAGEWRISHRRLKSPGVWEDFEGEATCFTTLNGVGSIEELRVPARKFIGMGVRLLDVAGGRWADYWVPGGSGLLTPPPLWGGFKEGMGIFEAEDVEDGRPILGRGVWDRITGNSHRWRQLTSRDGGKTWEASWLMDWRRA